MKLVSGTSWHWRDKSDPSKPPLKLFAKDGLTDEYCTPQMTQFCHENGFAEPYVECKVPKMAKDDEEEK